MDIRYVTPEDKPFWYSLDRHLPVPEFDKKVRDHQGYVISIDEKVEADVKADVEKAAEEVSKVEKKTRGRAKKVAEDAKKTVKTAEKKVKTAAEKVADEAKKVEKKTETQIKKASKGKRMITTVTIQSPLGGEITPDEIKAKVGDVDHIYVRVDQNKAYWVKGEETGSVDLW